MKWGTVGWEEKSEVIIVPFAPASIRAEYLRYPVLLPISINLEQLL